ncbi:hypothetical protein Tco_1544675 [Tanacetum coccineum]
MGVNSRSSFYTKEDQTQKISKSVFVTNFSDHFSAKDLWNVYQLIENLCTIWNGRLRLHANVARFERAHINNVSQPKNNVSHPYNTHVESVKNLGANKGSFADVLKSGRAYPSSSDVNFPSIVLDDVCLMERDFSSSLMGISRTSMQCQTCT